jgi:hypothetical protein
MGSILFLAALAFATPIRFGGSGGSAVTGIAVDKDGNICVAGTTTSFDFPTRNAFQGANPGTRLVVTRDSGRTWQPVSNLPGTPTGAFTVGAVAVDPTNPQVLYVGVMNALQKSVDGGQTL